MSNFGPSPALDPKVGAGTGSSPSPRVSELGEPISRAFSSEEQLSSFASNLVRDNSSRNMRNAKITAKLNSERPHDPAKLEQAGLSWKSNFTTRPLNTLVAKVVGRFPRAVDTARYLTASALPPTVPASDEKTQFFRRELTLFLRAQPGWNDLVESLSHEDVLFGYTAAAALDENDILPRPFRQDQFFVPVTTRQTPELSTALVFYVEIPQHTAYEMLRDAQASPEFDKRWRVGRFASAINQALPENVRLKGLGEDSRSYQDLGRQIAQHGSYVGSERVRLYHVLATELSGRVTHYILDFNYKIVFEHLDRFESMATATNFFSFEYGDGTMHGSKGLGRTAYAFASVLDRARNDAVDRLQMSGKIILQGPDNNHTRFKMNVIGSVVTFSSDWVISPSKLESSVESSVALDDYLSRLLDQMAGSVSPHGFEGRDRVTKGEIELLASREGERSDDVISRWLQQFGAMVWSIQKRILRPDHPNKDVQALYQKLSTQLLPEEIETLRMSPALSVVMDWSDAERQSIITAAVELQGNPLVNQKALLTEKLSAQVSPEFAKRIILPDEDPTVAAEATRMQMLENVALGNGVPVPVSPRDNHVVHLKSMVMLFQAGLEAAAANPGQDGALQFMLAHAAEHLNYAKAAGVDKMDPELQEMENLLKQVESGLKEVNTPPETTDAPPEPQAVGAVVGGRY